MANQTLPNYLNSLNKPSLEEYQIEQYKTLDQKSIKEVENDPRQEYDFKPGEIVEIERITSSKIMCNIGYGGFSTVKLIFNHQQKMYYALKVVSIIFIIF